jgi:hypothetical protein
MKGDGSQGKMTERLNIQALYQETELKAWYGQRVGNKTQELFKRLFKTEQLLVSQEGFLPG